jgi:hypothetical protein
MFIREHTGYVYKLSLLPISQMAAGPEVPVIVTAQTVVEWREDQAPEAAAAGRAGGVQKTTGLCAEMDWSQGTRSATMATTGPMTAAAALAILSAGTSAPTRPPKTSSRPSARRFAETGCAEAWRSATTSTR